MFAIHIAIIIQFLRNNLQKNVKTFPRLGVDKCFKEENLNLCVEIPYRIHFINTNFHCWFPI